MYIHVRVQTQCIFIQKTLENRTKFLHCHANAVLYVAIDYASYLQYYTSGQTLEWGCNVWGSIFGSVAEMDVFFP